MNSLYTVVLPSTGAVTVDLGSIAVIEEVRRCRVGTMECAREGYAVPFSIRGDPAGQCRALMFDNDYALAVTARMELSSAWDKYLQEMRRKPTLWERLVKP